MRSAETGKEGYASPKVEIWEFDRVSMGISEVDQGGDGGTTQIEDPFSEWDEN